MISNIHTVGTYYILQIVWWSFIVVEINCNSLKTFTVACWLSSHRRVIASSNIMLEKFHMVANQSAKSLARNFSNLSNLQYTVFSSVYLDHYVVITIIHSRQICTINHKTVGFQKMNSETSPKKENNSVQSSSPVFHSSSPFHCLYLPFKNSGFRVNTLLYNYRDNVISYYRYRASTLLRDNRYFTSR